MIRRGFTLIELLVVITILAILAGAALPYVQSYVAESRIAKAKTDLEEIARALAVYETREGEYTEANISGLTGRYLNKAPIDPWGQPYVVSPTAGIVYSTGPDRDDTDPAGKYDNISVAYQPPLALVAVKWVDRNQSGAFDAQNVPDQLQLVFSRKLDRVDADCLAANLDAWLTISPSGLLADEESITTNFVQAADEAAPFNNYPPVILTSNPRILVLSLKENYDPTANPLSLGAAYVYVDDPRGASGDATDPSDNLHDLAGNLSLNEQKVVVLPQ